jgi:hypothetical protein
MRAFKALAAGDPAGAVASNPLAVGMLAAAPLGLVYLARRRRTPAAAGRHAPRGRIPVPALIIAAVLVNWAYVLTAR